MAITRSRAEDRAEILRSTAPREWRARELQLSVVAALVVAAGLYFVHYAKTGNFAEIEKGLAAKQLLNLNDLPSRESVLPLITPYFAKQSDRDAISRNIYSLSGSYSNVGTILTKKFISGEQLHQLKPLFVVRSPAFFQRTYYRSIALFFAAFLMAHLWWSIRGFRGDQTFLPATLLLSGIGLIEMISLRDPVRDNMLFSGFTQGVVIGVLVMALASSLDYERIAGKLSYVPLLASFALSVLLILFGSGPGTSDAKVNLVGFQPVEIIRILLVFFLAGYFAQRWDILRHARETRESLVELTRRFDIPPVEYTLPILVSVVLALIFFFLQRDMGPALVFTGLFLTLYGIARGSAAVPVAGLALLIFGFAVGCFIGVPHNVGERVAMWRSPWDNTVRGGDQVADSLWSYASGGVTGAGPGLGEADLVPAAHTDLILASVGEEGGFVAVAAIFALYGWIVWRSLRIALRARTDYEFFLAAGLAAATALQVLLIAGGSLGVLPLSGVVTPFLSYGRTAMIANFAVFAILLSISSRPGDGERAAPFRAPVFAAGLIFAAIAGVTVAKAAYIQVARSGETIGAGTLVMQADGARRYQYNPRLTEIMREIPKGTIYDRNGLPLATSDWNVLEKHRAEYKALGLDIDVACRRTDLRHYPFGGLTFDLLGDLRTRTRWAATNTSFVERDSASRLRGYDDRPTIVDVKNPATGQMDRVLRYDYRELVPMLRHRHNPNHPAVRRILDRPRDVRMSIDARLEVQVSAILRNQLQQAHVEKGAAVVLDPANGDLLAAVSLPAPQNGTEEQPEGNPFLDRARYGVYPPGSTFKVVTAMAALRKNPQLIHKQYQCIALGDGRVGNYIQGSKRPIRDDIKDTHPHGTLDLEHGLVVSCNAYFAQLGTYDVGADALHETAAALGIAASKPDTAGELKKSLPQSSYGQGEVVASPFQMARLAATVANGGSMPQGRWLIDENNNRTAAATALLPPDAAGLLGKFMREVVTGGTGVAASKSGAAIAGKTGTAELADKPSHAWFIGFAPYGRPGRKIAFSILVENGVYGGTAAAPAGAAIADAAVKLGLIKP